MQPQPVDLRRLARRQALQVREAARLADCLRMFMLRAGVDPSSAEQIAKDLRVQAADLDVKAFGRISPRKGTKPSGHPLLEGRILNELFLDESGSTNPKSGISVFAVGGISLGATEAEQYVQEADRIKKEFFGHTNFSFHEPRMRKRDGEFRFGNDPIKQGAFAEAIYRLLLETPFVAFGAAVRTQAYQDDFLAENLDPYLPNGSYSLAITLLLERYVDYLAYRPGSKSIGRVHFESIGSKEDAERQLTYAELLLYGTQFVSQKQFCGWMETGCRFSPKSSSSPAELADIVAREVFEWVRGECLEEPLYWNLLKTKFYHREDGMHGKFGLKVFPDYDIRERIQEHRSAVMAQN